MRRVEYTQILSLAHRGRGLFSKVPRLKCNTSRYKDEGGNEENITNNKKTMQKSIREEPKQ